MSKQILTLLLLICIGACTPVDERATLQANHLLASTQIADLRMTATVQAARARTTVDYVGTRAALSATQSRFLESTLSSRGTPVAYLEEQRERIIGSSPTPTITPTAAEEAEATIEVQPSPAMAALPQETPTATVPPVTPFGLVATPTQPIAQPADPNAPRLEEFTIASGVRSDDCALDSRASFSTQTAEIYIVATAVNMPAGSLIEARWFRAGAPIGPVYSFQPGFAIERACIWFYVDPTDFDFLPGEYAVDLLLNGEPVSPLLPFTITEP